MMIYKRVFSYLLVFFCLFLLINISTVKAQEVHDEDHPHNKYLEELAVGQNASEQAERLKQIREQIAETQALLQQTQQKKATLQNEIAYQDNQIKLTTLKVEETENEIENLTGQINQLEGVLGGLSEVFAERAVETYKLKRLGDSFVILLTANNVSEFISRFNYIQRIQQNDRELLLQMQTAQTNYEGQRSKVEALRDRLESQRSTLARQKTSKENLLKLTQNDEKKYQELLANLRANESAIQKALSSLIAQIVAGTASGSTVKKGQVVGQQGNTGYVFPKPSSSCPECGSHLHFMVLPCNVTSSGLSCHSNPEPYLSDGQYGKPLEYKYISQGYGSTAFAQSGAYSNAFHTGLDMVGNHGTAIYSIADGTVYYGVDSAGGKYALVKHRDDFWSAYWHLQ